MSTEANKDAFRKLVTVFAGGDPSVIDQLIAADAIDHATPPGMPQGLQGAKAAVAMWNAAFTNPTAMVEHILAEGDLVAARVTTSGTHTGEFMGIPPTGKSFTMNEFHLVRYANGKMVEHWSVEDTLGMMRQLGVIQD